MNVSDRCRVWPSFATCRVSSQRRPSPAYPHRSPAPDRKICQAAVSELGSEIAMSHGPRIRATWPAASSDVHFSHRLRCNGTGSAITSSTRLRNWMCSTHGTQNAATWASGNTSRSR